MLAIFLDMETTGLDQSKHHAIDIAFTIVDVSTGKEILSYQSIIKHPLEIWLYHDPVSIEVNGYTFEAICKGKEVQVVKDEIIELFKQAGIKRGSSCFICQNPGFDRSFFSQLVDVYTQETLNWPYHWLDLASMYYASVHRKCILENKPFPKEFNLSKNAIAKSYGLAEEENRHIAMNGVNHLIACYRAVLGI